MMFVIRSQCVAISQSSIGEHTVDHAVAFSKQSADFQSDALAQNNGEEGARSIVKGSKRLEKASLYPTSKLSCEECLV